MRTASAARPYLVRWQYYNPDISLWPGRLSELGIVGTAWTYTWEMSEMSSAHQPVIYAITWPERIWTHFGNVCVCSITSLFSLFGRKHSSFKRFPIRHTMICSDVTIRVLISKLPLFEIWQGKRVVVSSERTLLSLIERVSADHFPAHYSLCLLRIREFEDPPFIWDPPFIRHLRVQAVEEEGICRDINSSLKEICWLSEKWKIK